MIGRVCIQILLLIVILIYSGTDANAQADTSLYIIETTDGNTFRGYLIRASSDTVYLDTDQLGLLSFPRSSIVSMIVVEPEKLINDKYWYDNPQSTRHFWQPTGYGLKAGEGYYQNIWVLWNQFSVGLTDHVSLGAGIIPLFLFGGAPTPMWITPKVSIPVVRDKFNVGAGALLGYVAGEDEAGFGMLYGVTTFGSRDRHVTTGLGYGFVSGDWANSPTITLSGTLRVTQKTFLMTENYYIGSGGDNVVLISVGGRSLLNKIGLDYALIIPAVGGDIFAIPWLGITIPFGNNKSN